MRKTIGRFTFRLRRDKGMRIDCGREIYHDARSYWIRVGEFTAYVEIEVRR